MGHARKWAGVLLWGLVAASLCLAAPGIASAAAPAGTEVLDWQVGGFIDAGGIYSFGERSSSEFNKYRDMDNGFVGELSLHGEKKTSPYYFELDARNPARDDQAYEGVFGRWGMFRLDLGWDRTPHVLSNTAQTIFQENRAGGNVNFNLPSQQRSAIAADTNAAACGTLVRWNCPVEYAVSSPAIGAAQKSFIRDTINGLLRPVELGFNVDEGHIDFEFTPTDALRFDMGYANLRREGHRPIGTVVGSPGGAVTELAIPIDNTTHEVKLGAEFARPEYALQFRYTGSIFENEFQSYTWDNPGYFGTTDAANFAGAGRAVRVNQGQISAPPDNFAHTFSLTGSAGLPLRSRVNATFAYSLLRQDETFLTNTVNRASPIITNADTAGNTSADAKADLALANVVLTSRPITNVTVTGRYRFFEYMNDTPVHTFACPLGEGLGTCSPQSTKEERFTKQNAGLDVGWRPIRPLALKAGYEYEHWNRGDFDDKPSFANDEHIARFAVDVTPIDWLLGRVTYSFGQRYLENYGVDTTVPTNVQPQFFKFNYADRKRHRVDLLLQFTPWETVGSSVSFGYALDDYYNSLYGLTDDSDLSAGLNVDWTPLPWLTLSGDYTYEHYRYKIVNQSGNLKINDWESKATDEFHTFGANAVVNVIPKKFDVTLGYSVTLGLTKIRARNIGAGFTPPVLTATSTSTAQAFDWDTAWNLLQTFRIVGRYRLTERLSVRGGFAYERYEEEDYARDPMRPFMGDYEVIAPNGPTPNVAIQSVWLGATQPRYESYTVGLVVRYGF